MPGRVTINRRNVEQVLSGPLGPVVRTASQYGRRVTAAAKREAPVDKGAGRASIGFLLLIVPGVSVTFRVGTDLEYMRYQHEGTGIYGPKHRRITPVSAKVLRFPVKGVFGPVRATKSGRPGKRKGRGNIVFAKSVRGVPPNDFLVRALRDNIPWPVRVRG